MQIFNDFALLLILLLRETISRSRLWIRLLSLLRVLLDDRSPKVMLQFRTEMWNWPGSPDLL